MSKRITVIFVTGLKKTEYLFLKHYYIMQAPPTIPDQPKNDQQQTPNDQLQTQNLSSSEWTKSTDEQLRVAGESWRRALEVEGRMCDAWLKNLEF